MSKSSSAKPEIIEPRPDERLDEGAVAEFLRGRIEGSELPLRVRQFSGGHANLTYLLEYSQGDRRYEYVLRRPPLGPVAKGAHDMGREYRALSRLWRAFPQAPRAFVFCDDHSVAGADFFVMERRDGVVVRRQVPEVFGAGADPQANRKISRALVDTLAELHSVDPEGVELADLGKPAGFLQRQVEGWAARYEAAKTGMFALAEEVGAWLLDELPDSPPATLLHNDWKLDNIALDPSDPGRCVAVFDWDMCTVGDPLCDLGTLLCTWFEKGEPVIGIASPTQNDGFMTRSEGVARYAECRGIDPAQVPYYHVFGTYKMAVVLQQIYVRYHRGQTHDERFAGMEKGARGLFERAATLRP
jgi:aminoglycoside phosphotransferase (APT) family kinase protein